ISRPTILTAFLGYSLVIVALLFDLGRPYRIWHPLVMWNPHSVMFEVAWCVMLYTIVLALEFSPIVFERFNLKVPLKMIRNIYLPIVIAGVLLSTLHQSSLGTLYVIVPDKLHGLWYSPLLPVFFFISAIGAGLAMTIFESFLSYRAFGKRLEHSVLTGLARVIVVVLAVYFVLKFQDLARRGNLHLAFEISRESVLFWGELGLGVILPMLLLVISKIRETQVGLFFSAVLVIMGFIVSRLNVSITGMLNSETYFPKWTEFAVTVSIVALGFVIFGFAVKHFPVFPKEELESGSFVPPPRRRSPVFSGNTVLALWAFLLIGMITYGMTKSYEDNHNPRSDDAASVSRAVDPLDQELELPDEIVFPLGEDSPGVVTFRHETHVLLQDKPSCSACHSGMYDILEADDSQKQPLTMEVMYEGKSCGKCHNGDDAFDVEEECMTCHIEE
ncbi:hypothetical protein GWO43_11940, partial [candidate division KSB1 bacterium]|nr:hypothetical protein [candidate division KSB1 bacterium]NIR70904.1 hypothetical protein [candidate division KSB1 bacterium]NIS24674.1 hypothetical protein [candidate division KSB1 bacterium]NIT71576.1 hypothetical protein [candidate division KSB1 bacterium]NIU25274.1 hypothetical protein [candidate division KSB1 bacterium]